MEKGCETCKYHSDMSGECEKGIVDLWTGRDCDTSKCSHYRPDLFYIDLEMSAHNRDMGIALAKRASMDAIGSSWSVSPYPVCNDCSNGFDDDEGQ